MDPECTMLSKISKREKDKCHDFAYMWNVRKYKQTSRRETDSDAKNILMVER